MLHIPPEIILHTLHLGLDSLGPDPSSTTHRNQSIPERRHFLLNAMLVSRDWTLIATELLYRTESVYNNDRPFRLWFEQWAPFANKYTVTHLRFRCWHASSDSDDSSSDSEGDVCPVPCSPSPKLILDVLDALSSNRTHPLSHLEIPMASVSLSVMQHPRLSRLAHLHVYDNKDDFDYDHHLGWGRGLRPAIPSFQSLHYLQLSVDAHSGGHQTALSILSLIETLSVAVEKLSVMSITVRPGILFSGLPFAIHHLLRAAKTTLVTLDLLYDYDDDYLINVALNSLSRLTSFSEYALGGAIPNCTHLPLGGRHLLSNRMRKLPSSLVQYTLYNDLEPDNPRGMAPHLLHFLMWYRRHRAQFPNLVEVKTPLPWVEEGHMLVEDESEAEEGRYNWTETMWIHINALASVLRRESPKLSFSFLDQRHVGTLHFTPLLSEYREPWCLGIPRPHNIVERDISLRGPRIARNQCGE